MQLKINSIFKIFVQAKEYNYHHPWESTIVQGHGTGFCISHQGKKFIATCYHVVEDALRIFIDDVEFKVVFGDKILDIAFLDGPTEKMEPLEIGTAVSGNIIYVQGFPLGYRGLNITEGIISKLTKLDAGLVKHLAFQVTAIINSGNSGGPVFYNDRVVGIAYRGNNHYQIFYVIPFFMIDFALRMMDGIRHKYLDILWQPINPLMNMDGALLINKTHCVSEIEGIKIQKDGQIRFSDFMKLLGYKDYESTEMITFKYIIDFLPKKKINFGKLSFKTTEFDITFQPPEWLIYGGWVFVPITHSYMSQQGHYDELGKVKIVEIIENEYNIYYARYKGRNIALKWSSLKEMINTGKNMILPLSNGIDIYLSPKEKKFTKSTHTELFGKL